MSQVNVDRGATRSDGSAAAAAGFSAATVVMLLVGLVMLAVIAYFALTSFGVMQPIVINQQPAVERTTDRTTIIQQQPSTSGQSSSSSSSGTTGSTGSTSGTSSTTGTGQR